MANDKSASKQYMELRRRAEKALPKQAPENFESAARSHEEMLSLIHDIGFLPILYPHRTPLDQFNTRD